jgi:uncharacterized membrane protein
MLKQIIIITIVMLLLDAVYLSTFSTFFNNIILQVQGSKIKFKLLGAVLCYISLVAGLYYFIVRPHKSIKEAFFLGIVIYSVYETTNYALLDKWPLKAVIMDTLWGGILFALTTYITYAL